MARKKGQQESGNEASKADLTNLIDAAKSSLFQFDDEESLRAGELEQNATEEKSPLGAAQAQVFDADEVEDVKASLQNLEQDSREESLGDFNEAASLVGDDRETEVEEAESLFSEDTVNTIDALESHDLSEELEGTELEGFDAAEIEELEFIEETQLESIIESVLFATDRPVSLPTLKQIFKGTNVTTNRIKRTLENLRVEYAGGRRGVTIEEVGSGYQLRTKIDNMEFLRRSFKAKSFKLSGPALEVLAIVAYKQPVVKAEVDEIRGVESGHLLRALMEKNLVLFAGKSDLPGKPMQYATSRKFLEIFGLRNLKELPTLSQIDELLPEGIGEDEQKPQLAELTDGLSEKVGQSYSEGEEELLKITDQLEKIDTSSEFFEKEKLRQKQERDAEKARNLREALAVGEEVSSRDKNWLKRYDEQISQGQTVSESVLTGVLTEEVVLEGNDESAELEAALQAWDAEDEDITERLEANDLAVIDEEIV